MNYMGFLATYITLLGSSLLGMACTSGPKLPQPPWPCGSESGGRSSDCEKQQIDITRRTENPEPESTEENSQPNETETEVPSPAEPEENQEFAAVADPDVMSDTDIIGNHDLLLADPLRDCLKMIENVSCGSECKTETTTPSIAPLKAEIWRFAFDMNDSGLTYIQKQAQCRADLAIAIIMQLHETIKPISIDGDLILPYNDEFDNNTDGSQRLTLFNLPVKVIQDTCQINCERFDDFNQPPRMTYINKEKFLHEAILRLDEAFNDVGIPQTLSYIATGDRDTNAAEAIQFSERIYKITSWLHKNSDDTYRTNETRIFIAP